jgi:para-aminobenzoate synthetase component 1
MEGICYLNSNDGTGILAFGIEEQFVCANDNSLSDVQLFIDKYKGSYIFGCLSYDLKNEIENLKSTNYDGIEFPNVILWKPKYVVQLNKENYTFLQGEKNSESFEFLDAFAEEETDSNFHKFNVDFIERTSKEKYINTVLKLKDYIQRGDIYEINYCQEYYAENVEIPYALGAYFKLNNISKAPFSSFLQIEDFLVFCGSPERFIQKTREKLISQPIKGTAPRDSNSEIDLQLKKELENNPKERSENIMIVDLVRNDFSKIAKKETVKVDELCGIYSFKTVHQMISTVSCEPQVDKNFTDIIKATFPMGSMTGAPKYSAMQLIESHEDFKRGLYSGSIGYISPNGDFDFNVVIRSMIYNKKKKYLSCSVGGAITILSEPEKEYEECLVKVKKLLDGMHDQ